MIPDMLKRGSLIPRLFLVEERASSPGLFSLSSHIRIEEISLGTRLEEGCIFLCTKLVGRSSVC